MLQYQPEMEREVVLAIADMFDLKITIRPDGSILCPFEEDRVKLKWEYQKVMTP